MKEPDKWCIKVTPENREAIEKWRTANVTLNGYGYCVNETSFKSTIGYWYPDKPSGYTEISFEEFKVYTSKPKDLTGRYVKCLVDEAQGTNCKAGEIYKLVSLDNIVETQIYKLENGFCLCISPTTTDKWELLPEDYSANKPLKQAVHCKTQEEWDFVTEKLGNDGINWFKDPDWGNNKSFCISFGGKNQSQTLDFYINAGYQILSFQEWCDLNGYKMKKETMFEPGKWYSFYWTWYNSGLVIIKVLSENDNSVKVSYYYRRGSFYDNSECDCAFVLSEIKDIKELSIEEIQQYLPEGHPDKIKSDIKFEVGDWVLIKSAGTGNGLPANLESVFVQLLKIDEDKQPTGHLKGKSDFMVCYNKNYYRTKKDCIIRHATPEEINNHLISIGQIPNKEKYEYQGEYKPSNSHLIDYGIKIHEGIRWTEPVPMTNENWKSKMILSTDDEELPMVNIIKTNTVKQLLNNE